MYLEEINVLVIWHRSDVLDDVGMQIQQTYGTSVNVHYDVRMQVQQTCVANINVLFNVRMHPQQTCGASVNVLRLILRGHVYVCGDVRCPIQNSCVSHIPYGLSSLLLSH